MRKKLLDLLQCKRCASHPLTLANAKEDGVEIVTGVLICGTCGLTYPINEGVPDTIIGEVVTELSTAKENEDARTPLNDEWLLSLPYPKIHPLDTTFEHKGGDKALNFKDMLDRMALKGTETILELGSGNCWATNAFVQRGCRCVAVDVRMRRYWGLRSGRVYIDTHGKYFERVLSNLDHPPFVDGAFDIVFAQSSLQYAEDLDACLREIFRILKTDGRLVLSYSGVYGLFKKMGPDCPGYYFPKLVRALNNAGFHGDLIFPVYLEKHFREGIPEEKRFHRVGRAFSIIWNRMPWFQTVFKKFGMYPTTLLFGVPVNLIAAKSSQQQR